MFPKNRFYGLWSPQRPTASVVVKIYLKIPSGLAIGPRNGYFIPRNPARINRWREVVQGGKLWAAYGPLRPALSRVYQSQRARSLPR